MKKRILVVDDSPVIVMILRAQLEEGGYDVITAADGAEGVKKALEEKPDLILLDVIMPKLDGFQTLQELKAQASVKQVPVVMLSVKGDTSAVLESEALGATDYIIKGCEAEELLECIQRYM